MFSSLVCHYQMPGCDTLLEAGGNGGEDEEGHVRPARALRHRHRDALQQVGEGQVLRLCWFHWEVHRSDHLQSRKNSSWCCARFHKERVHWRGRRLLHRGLHRLPHRPAIFVRPTLHDWNKRKRRAAFLVPFARPRIHNLSPRPPLLRLQHEPGGPNSYSPN